MAHAGTVSLLNVLQKLELFSNQLSIPFPNSEISSICDKIYFLLSFLKKKNLESNIGTDSVHDLEKQIIVAIYETEDLIGSHMSTYLLDSSDYGNNSASAEEIIFAEKLQKVVQKLESIKETAPKVAGYENIDGGRDEQRPTRPASQPFVLSRFVEGNKKLVGREDELMKIKDQLIGSSSKLQVVAVVGMIGIGKTAVVNEVYNDPSVGNTFDYQAWVSVGPRNRLRDILVSLVKPDPDPKLNIEELGICLAKMLSGRRYLILLDDMRDIVIWKVLRKYFPDEKNQSRIIMTTRQMELARDAAYIREIRFLNEDESWDLLRYTAIGEKESCPPQLVKIGKTISQDCQGLPLKIIVLGSLLSRMSLDTENWSTLAENRKMQNREMLEVTQDLYHEELPQHIKACFLYMVAFPQYQQISISKLFKLWIAEDFLTPKEYHTLEEVAEECLQYLVDRSLILVHGLSSTCHIKICSIHSAIWPFFDHVAAEYKILQSIESCEDSVGPSHRRFSIHKNILFAIKDVYDSIASVSNTRSFLFTGPYHPYPLLQVNFTSFRLLKVLDAVSIRFYKFPVDILKLVLLRFLALTLGRGELPSSLSNLAQLQFLIVRLHSSIKSSGSPCFLPLEIWNMKELRHLQVMGSDLPAPPFDENALLPNLITLSDVSTLSCTKEILERIPNLKKLGIRVELAWDAAAAPPLYIFCALEHLHQLEKFKYFVTNPFHASVVSDSIPTFPSSLEKLTLSGCGLSWENMEEIAQMPNLEVLKLQLNAFQGPEWGVYEGQFGSLRFLLLEDLDIEHWRVDETSFPQLEHLAIHHCYKLHEIPSELEETLEMIEVVDCSPSVVDSAMRIKEKQDESGNTWGEALRVSIHSSWTGNTRLRC